MEYDKTNRLIKYNGKEVKYDKEGNMVYGPLNGVMTSFTYDCRNRLVQAGTTKYEYDAENNRTAVIKNTGTKEEVRTEYVVDSVEELSRVLMAVEKTTGNTASGSGIEGTTGNEALQTTYLYYGNGLSAQENEKKGYLTYHFNNVGSTNAVTDEKGTVKYSYTYNPYGELTQGSYGQVMFLFNGQYGVASDDNGLYYMRARYYNVLIKRFINQDVVTGSIAESQSLNRYAYVEGNPVSYLDPFGLEKKAAEERHEVLGKISMASAGIVLAGVGVTAASVTTGTAAPVVAVIGQGMVAVGTIAGTIATVEDLGFWVYDGMKGYASGGKVFAGIGEDVAFLTIGKVTPAGVGDTLYLLYNLVKKKIQEKLNEQ